MQQNGFNNNAEGKLKPLQQLRMKLKKQREQSQKQQKKLDFAKQLFF
jgi:hypothetical protein